MPRKLVEAVIDAGNEAPSGMNRQPWRFVVVESEAMRKTALRRRLPEVEEGLRGPDEEPRLR